MNEMTIIACDKVFYAPLLAVIRLKRSLKRERRIVIAKAFHASLELSLAGESFALSMCCQAS